MSARSNASSRLRIVVLGYIVRGPLGGMAWSDLHYVLGLRSLGHDVWFLEDSDDYASCVDPVEKTIGTDPTHSRRHSPSAAPPVSPCATSPPRTTSARLPPHPPTNR